MANGLAYETPRDAVVTIPAEHRRTVARAIYAAAASLDALASKAQTALVSGEEVSLHGFGTFSVNTRPAGVGRNPRTGEAIKIAAKRGVKFKPAAALRDALNQ